MGQVGSSECRLSKDDFRWENFSPILSRNSNLPLEFPGTWWKIQITARKTSRLEIKQKLKTKKRGMSTVEILFFCCCCPKWLKIIGCKTITGFRLDYSFRSVLTPIAEIWAFPLSGMVHGLHIRLPVWKIEPAVVHQNLQQVLSIGKCGFILRAHIPDFWRGQERLHRLQGVPACHQHHLKWECPAEAGLGIQVILRQFNQI